MRMRMIAVLLAVAVSLLGLTDPAAAKKMSDECAAQIAAANQLTDGGDPAAALAAFDALTEDCGTKDAKEAIHAGRAHALNRQQKYAEAITEANIAIDDNDGESLFGLFERAYAQEKLGNMDAATADYNQIIALTEKNENVAERATIYAKVADLNYKAGKTAEAETYLAKAVELDPNNTDFRVMRGDWAVYSGDYDAAFQAYDQVVALGKADAEMYQIRSAARLKMVQDKYGTTNAQQLRDQMTASEKAQVCVEITKALDLGVQDMQLDMFSALVCQ